VRDRCERLRVCSRYHGTDRDATSLRGRHGTGMCAKGGIDMCHNCAMEVGRVPQIGGAAAVAVAMLSIRERLGSRRSVI
jgi:hypothetical protein